MHRNAFARIAFLLLMVVALPVMASRYAYIPRSSDNQVSVIDTQTNTLVTSIAVGSLPWGVAVHPAGHRVYVPAVNSNNVSVINTATNTVVATVAVGTSPYHAAVRPDGAEVYVPNYSSGTVSVISTATNTVVATIGGMNTPNAVAISPSGRFAYVTSYSLGSVYVIDTATRTFTTIAGMSVQSEGIAVHPSGRYVYTVGNAATVVSILDTTTNTIATSANIGNSQWGVAVHPNGRYYYVTRGGDELRVFRTSDNVQVALVDVGSGTRSPTGISLTASGNFAYVSNRGTDSVTVVNTVTNGVAATLASSGNPYALGTAIQRPLFGHGSITSGQNHSCRVRADMSVNCWGRNDQLQADAPAGSFTQVVSGSSHNCALGVSGAVTCWGNNTYAQSTPAAGSFQLLAAGARHTCGIKTDGSVACWGQNDQGQASPAAGTDFQAISAGTSHTCAVRNTGAVACWGRSTEGQLALPAGSYLQVVAGGAVTCGLKSDQTVVCAGDNTDGKATPPSGAFTRLATQNNFVCGLRHSGGLVCWGTDTDTETLPPAVTHADFSTGRYHGCSLQALGVAQCWGSSTYNQAPQFEITPMALTSGTSGVAYAGTQTFTMSVTNPGIRYPYVPRTPAFAVVAGSLPPGMSLSVGGVLSGTPSLGGSYTFTVQGEDANGFVAERAYTLVVDGAADTTAPVIQANVEGLAGTNGWYRGNVVVSWSVVDPESQIVSKVGCDTVVVSTETSGETITCSAQSAGGNGSGSVTIKLDKTAPTGLPTVSSPIALLNQPITAQANGVDSLSGVASEVCDAVPTNVVGPKDRRYFCTITDEAGNVSVRPGGYRVYYGFQGFTDTVVNPGLWNSALAGQVMTFKFQLVDFNGAPISGVATADMVKSVDVACPTKIGNVIPVSVATPGLVEIGSTGSYEFTWTAPATAGCRRISLDLGDGNTGNRVLIKTL